MLSFALIYSLSWRLWGAPPSAAQRFVVRQLLVGSLEQARLYVGFARSGRLAPDAEAGDGQTRRSDRPNARRDAQWTGRERRPRCGRVVLGRTVLEPWAEEAAAVTGHRTIAPLRVGVKGLFLPDELLPRLQQLCRVPLPIRAGRPGTPDGLLGQPQRSQPRDHGSSPQEQAPAEEHPQEMKEAESGANRHTLYHRRQDAVYPVDYGRHRASSRQVAGRHNNLTLPDGLPDVPFSSDQLSGK